MKNDGNAVVTVGAGLIARPSYGEHMEAPHFRYHLECWGADGTLKWVEEFENVVTTAGKNSLLDVYFSSATQITAWYMGLIDADSYGAGPVAGDTMASHSGWVESSEYSDSPRPTVTFSAASNGSKATSAAVAFHINGTTTIKGAFVCSNSTKGGTGGTLYSAGTFTGGDRAVQNGDTLNVTGSWSV